MDKETPLNAVDFVSAEQFKQLREAADHAARSTSLISYTSAGRLLIMDTFREVGDEQRALNLLAAMDSSMRATVLIGGLASDSKVVAPEASLSTERVDVIAGSLSDLSGYMGKFEAIMTIGEKTFNLGEALSADQPYYDLVLDLTVPTYLQMDTHPVGYFAPENDAQKLQQALQELPDLVGDFERPVFVEYNEKICAHGRSGISGCTRCIDVCPTTAITSLKELIEVDPYLCQGGGACATACPGGALSYVYPAANDWLEALRKKIALSVSEYDVRPVVLIHDGEAGAALIEAGGLVSTPSLLLIEVEEAASIGIESWLSLLVYGARAIEILVPSSVPAGVANEIGRQVRVAGAIVEGMGFPAAIRALENLEDRVEAKQHAFPEIPLGTFSTFSDKRTNLRLATDHLHAHAAAPAESVKLPIGASFGRVDVNQDACTLCMACVSVCPMHALNDGQDLPQLHLIESQCVQCGICAQACPESAIELEPRYVYDSVAARTKTILHEEQPFCCIACGVPFATQKIIARMNEKLAAHWMFTDEDAKKRLHMCEDCRVKDIFLKNEQGIATHKPAEPID